SALACGIFCTALLVALLALTQPTPEHTVARSTQARPAPPPVGHDPVVAHFDPAAIPPDRKLPHAPAELIAVAGESRQRHWGAVQCVAVSPDDKLIASAGHDNAVRIWDAATGQERASFAVGGNGIAALAFRADGRLTAVGLTAGKTTEIREWDPGNGTSQPHELRATAGADAADLSPDGRLVALRYWKQTSAGPAAAKCASGTLPLANNWRPSARASQ